MLSLDALIAYHKGKMVMYRTNYLHVVKHRNTSKESDSAVYKELRKRDLKNYKLHRDALKTLECLIAIHNGY